MTDALREWAVCQRAGDEPAFLAAGCSATIESLSENRRLLSLRGAPAMQQSSVEPGDRVASPAVTPVHHVAGQASGPSMRSTAMTLACYNAEGRDFFAAYLEW
jgi:hypothetical protein